MTAPLHGEGLYFSVMNRKLKIFPHIQVMKFGDEIYFWWRDLLQYKISEIKGIEERLISLLDGTKTLTEIITILKKEFPNISYKYIISIIKKLKKNNILLELEKKIPEFIFHSSKELDNKKINLYNRQLLYFDIALRMNNNKDYNFEKVLEIQKRLENARILLLGLGGVGSMELYFLACAGIGEIVGVDFDRVEVSNLNRSFLFSFKDVGKFKTTVLKRKISFINPFTKFKPIRKRIKSVEDLNKILDKEKRWDFVIRGLDRPPEVRDWINEVCVERNIPHIGGGYMECSGFIDPMYVPGKTSCRECLKIFLKQNYSQFKEIKEEKQLLSHIFMAASFAPPTAFIASFVILEVIKELTKIAEPMTYNRRFLIHFFPQFEIYSQQIPVQKSCVLCQKK